MQKRDLSFVDFLATSDPHPSPSPQSLCPLSQSSLPPPSPVLFDFQGCPPPPLRPRRAYAAAAALVVVAHCAISVQLPSTITGGEMRGLCAVEAAEVAPFLAQRLVHRKGGGGRGSGAWQRGKVQKRRELRKGLGNNPSGMKAPRLSLAQQHCFCQRKR